MKFLNLTFDDAEFEQLKKVKKETGLGWERYFLEKSGIFKPEASKQEIEPIKEPDITQEINNEINQEVYNETKQEMQDNEMVGLPDSVATADSLVSDGTIIPDA